MALERASISNRATSCPLVTLVPSGRMVTSLPPPSISQLTCNDCELSSSPRSVTVITRSPRVAVAVSTGSDLGAKYPFALAYQAAPATIAVSPSAKPAFVSQPLPPLGLGEFVRLDNDGGWEDVAAGSAGGLEGSWCGDSRRKFF